jgi:hypothetical protein
LAVRNTGSPPKATPIKATVALAPESKGKSRFSPSAILASCLGVVVSAVSAVAVGLFLVGMYARDIVSNYFPNQAEQWGLGFLATPPAAPDPVKTTEWYSCDAHFQRSALSLKTVEYTIHCTAKVPLKLEQLHVAVYSPTAAELSSDLEGGTPIDSKDLLTEPKALQPEEGVDYTGTLNADAPMVLDHNRKFGVTGTFSYPDDTGTPDHSLKYEMHLRTAESVME